MYKCVFIQILICLCKSIDISHYHHLDKRKYDWVMIKDNVFINIFIKNILIFKGVIIK